MLDLKSAYKKLSFFELKQRWEEYKKLPLHAKQALQTYAVASAIIVCVLVSMVVSLSHGQTQRAEPLDRLGLLIELTR
jgi:phytoene/squalene synthetase